MSRNRVVAAFVALVVVLGGVFPVQASKAVAVPPSPSPAVVPSVVPASGVGVGMVPLYRFYNYWTGAHFFTASEDEKNNVIRKWDYETGRGPWKFEGIAAQLTDAQRVQVTVNTTKLVVPPGQKVIYRFYNYWTGAHFFTASASERDDVIAKWDYFSGKGPWNYEGEAYTAFPATSGGGCATPGTVPFFRFFNYWTGAHFYTTSASEKTEVIAKWDYFSGKGPWNYEGVAYCVTPVEPLPDPPACSSTLDFDVPTWQWVCVADARPWSKPYFARVDCSIGAAGYDALGFQVEVELPYGASIAMWEVSIKFRNPGYFGDNNIHTKTVTMDTGLNSDGTRTRGYDWYFSLIKNQPGLELVSCSWSQPTYEMSTNRPPWLGAVECAVGADGRPGLGFSTVPYGLVPRRIEWDVTYRLRMPSWYKDDEIHTETVTMYTDHSLGPYPPGTFTAGGYYFHLEERPDAELVSCTWTEPRYA